MPKPRMFKVDLAEVLYWERCLEELRQMADNPRNQEAIHLHIPPLQGLMRRLRAACGVTNALQPHDEDPPPCAELGLSFLEAANITGSPTDHVIPPAAAPEPTATPRNTAPTQAPAPNTRAGTVAKPSGLAEKPHDPPPPAPTTPKKRPRRRKRSP